MSIAAKALAASEAQERPGATEYGFWLFLAIAVGRINQLIPGLSSLPLAKLAIVISCGALLVDKRTTLPPLSPDGRGLLRAGIGMACLAVLLTPASFWLGSSVHFVLFDMPPLIAATALACAMRRSWTSLRGTLLVLLLCGFALGALAALRHVHGRADDTGTMYDPNDLAYVLVTIVPLGLAFRNVAKTRVHKVLYTLMTAINVGALLLTESRGGLLGLLTVLILMVFLPLGVTAPGHAQMGLRRLRASLAIALVILGGSAAVWDQLPQSAQQRYMTLLHLNHDYNTNLEDTTGRESIWLQGLRAFRARPMGYGPQTYQMVDMRFGGKFKAPHNSYLQALVELGPLGLWFLLRMYFLTLRAMQRTRSSMLARDDPSPEHSERAVIARSLQYGVLGNMVSGFFLSDAYSMLPWVLFGLCAAVSALPLQPLESPKPPASVTRRLKASASPRSPLRPRRSRAQPTLFSTGGLGTTSPPTKLQPICPAVPSHAPTLQAAPVDTPPTRPA